MTSPPRRRRSVFAAREGIVGANLPILLLAGHLAALSAAGCASRVAARTIATPDCGARLLFATMNTDFKRAVVSGVAKALAPDRVCIKVIDVEDLEAKATTRYAAVVVISDYQFFRLDSEVRRFIESVDARGKQKIVLLTTAGSPNRVDKLPEVDAISAASKPADAAAVAGRIVDKVRPLLSLK